MARASITRHGLAAAVLAAALTPGADAAAYCRTSVCNGETTAAVCTPAQGGDCGVPLRWPHPCIGFSVQEDGAVHADGTVEISYEETVAIFEQAFETWMNADCGGGQRPRLRISNAGPVSCDAQEYNQDRGNANLVVYRDQKWLNGGAGHTLALTTVTYNLDTGEIYDADVEINAADHELTTGDTGVQYDLPSIVTHEVGHFLGLSHTPDADATMFAGYMEGSTALRDLNADDMAGICAAYPPGEITACDPTPRHGFSTLCGADQPEPEEDDGCAVAGAGVGAGGGGAAGGIAVLALLGAAIRRRARRR